MKRLIAAVMVLAAAAAVVSARPAQATIYEVVASGTAFRVGGQCPTNSGANTINIPQGESVNWKNCDAFDHNITWLNGGFTNKPLAASGGTASQVFNAAGFFNYYCSIHGKNAMSGQVVVTGNPPTQAPATSSTTVATTTTLKPTTTTASTVDLNGVFDEDETTTSSSSTSTSLLTELAGGEDDGGSGNGLMIALLLVAIAAVGGGGYYAVRKMRET